MPHASATFPESAEPLCVLHVDDGREWRGGQHQVFLLAQGLARRGVRQAVATRAGSPLAERLAAEGIAVEPVDFRGELDWRAPRRLAELARAMKADVLHAHTAHAHAAALRAHKRLGRESGVRLVTTRRVDFAVGRGFFSGRKYRYPRQTFIAISNGVREVLIAGGVDLLRVELVASGVPPIPADKAWDRERARREFEIATDCFAVAAVGALTDHKGHRYLVEAAARLRPRFPRVGFWVLGEGELRGDLERRVAELGLAGVVHLAGHVPEARLKLAGFDAFVSSSHLEGLGTAILDAMLAGLPVIAAAAGGVTDAVIHLKTGRLCAPRDPDSLATELAHLIETPGDIRQKMAADARQNVELHFSAERMVEGNLEVYRGLVGTGGPS